MLHFIYHLITVLYSRIAKFSVNNSIIIRSKVYTNGSAVSFANSFVAVSTIKVHDHGNTIKCGGKIVSTTLDVWGCGNSVVIHNGVEISGSRIIVRGNDCKLTIGKGTHICNSVIICMGCCNEITIGEDCMMAEGSEFWNTDSHPIFDVNDNVINPSSPIHIGDRVWIGKNAKILKGVTIGNESIVGMGSLVTKSLENNTLNVGVPAKTIKHGVHWSRNFISI